MAVPSFERFFRESKGKPVSYDGNLLYLADFVPFHEGGAVRITFEHTSSEWRQGIKLRAPGQVGVAGKTIDSPIFLWEDTAPAQVELQLLAPSGDLEIANCWDTGDGVTQSWHNGAAMMIDDMPNGKRYRCNDGHPDDDFDDIIFTLEWLSRR
jgi:hypothetical protein